MVYPPCIDFLIVFLSCLRAGVVAVPVYPPCTLFGFCCYSFVDPSGARKNIHLFAGIQKNCSASVVLCNKFFRIGKAIKLSEYLRVKQLADIKNVFSRVTSEWPSVTWRCTDSYVSNLSPCAIPEGFLIGALIIPLDEPALSFPASSLCFLQYTSGSTSFPKGVMIAISNLHCNMDIIISALQADSSSIVVSWLPQYHDMGLIGSSLCLLYISLSKCFSNCVLIVFIVVLLCSLLFYCVPINLCCVKYCSFDSSLILNTIIVPLLSHYCFLDSLWG